MIEGKIDDCTLLLLIVVYVGEYVRRTGKLPSYSTLYNALKRNGVKVNYKRYERAIGRAESYRLVEVIELPKISDIFGGRTSTRRGRIPDKWISLTDKGEKLYRGLMELENLGLDDLVREVIRLLEGLESE